MDDQLQTYEILIEAPPDKEEARILMDRVFETLHKPSSPHPSIRLITPKIPDFTLVYNGAENLYAMQFNTGESVTPALCRNVRDILHARSDIDKERFNALNPLALSSEPSVAKRGVLSR